MLERNNGKVLPVAKLKSLLFDLHLLLLSHTCNSQIYSYCSYFLYEKRKVSQLIPANLIEEFLTCRQPWQ